MEDVGAQVAAPVFIHQPLAGRFCESNSMARKRSLPFQPTSLFNQNHSDNWKPEYWSWDSNKFVAKPLQPNAPHLGTALQVQPELFGRKEQNDSVIQEKSSHAGEDDENLQLKLGGQDGTRSSSSDSGNLNPLGEQQPVVRPNKRVRSGSPGGASYPKCQVDDCQEDLSSAKDYHRRHKVCEIHSKATKASVGKQMQRFCQQCSRFHQLSEFDEGKRSCRRRLAGHNRRRRKTQPEDTTSRLLVPGNHGNNGNLDLDIVNLLAAFARAQGNTDDRSTQFSSAPDKEQLINILAKINSIPLPENLTTKFPAVGGLNGSIQNQAFSESQSTINGKSSLPSTVNFLSLLSPNPVAVSSDAHEIQSHRSSQGSDSEKSKSACVDQATCFNLQRGRGLEFPAVGGERSSTSYQSPIEDSDSQMQETCLNLPLQLFNSSPEVDHLGKLTSSTKYFSSESSNPSGGRSPSSSPPVVHELFPTQSSIETTKPEIVLGTAGQKNIKVTQGTRAFPSIQLFGSSIGAAEHGSFQKSPYQAGHTCSSGSDHSPPSMNSDAQDRTGRINFKLFGKDPSHLPGALRAQIYNWLSNCPSEMEGYIRPGCIVLSLYISMPFSAWDQFEQNFLKFVRSLVKDSDTDFWRNGRFLVYTDKQMASHKDGKFRLCKSWRAWNTPELISVSPLAVVGGQETSLVLRGRNLTTMGTEIFCTHASGYTAREVTASALQESVYDEINLCSFKINDADTTTLGRCFLEVEIGSRSTAFPIIVADETICLELRTLETEIHEKDEVLSRMSVDEIQNTGRPGSREEVLYYLNELGWLFQRKQSSSFSEIPYYRLTRFKFLFIFSVEHDFCAVVKMLLDILVEMNLCREGLVMESLDMLSEIQLMSRAVKRKCRDMVDLLINYSIADSTSSSKKYVFTPHMVGPGGLTPLHLAACTSNSEDIVDALTNDPQEIGLHSWNSSLDANGLSPYAYASMRNNHSYNRLVTQKLGRKNGEVSISIRNEIGELSFEVDRQHKSTSESKWGQKSCSRCAVAAALSSRKFPGSQGLLQRPYIHSMLAIAAVCVCVCLFFRGSPDIGSVAPFKWENLRYGTM